MSAAACGGSKGGDGSRDLLPSKSDDENNQKSDEEEEEDDDETRLKLSQIPLALLPPKKRESFTRRVRANRGRSSKLPFESPNENKDRRGLSVGGDKADKGRLIVKLKIRNKNRSNSLDEIAFPKNEGRNKVELGGASATTFLRTKNPKNGEGIDRTKDHAHKRKDNDDFVFKKPKDRK